jgi:hypothetical protein
MSHWVNEWGRNILSFLHPYTKQVQRTWQRNLGSQNQHQSHRREGAWVPKSLLHKN